MGDVIGHNCGFCVAHTLHDAYSFIKSLGHRGRDAVGIAAIGSGRIDAIKWIGNTNNLDLGALVDIFPADKYHTYLAHNRYRTSSDSNPQSLLRDAHPHVIGGTYDNRGSHVIIRGAKQAIVHNGQVDPKYLYGVKDSDLRTSCDTEKVLHFYSKEGEHELIRKVPGAFSLAIADSSRPEVIVMRDMHGMKPASLGIKDGKFSVASETVAFRENGAEYVEDLTPGTIYLLGPNGDIRKTDIVKNNRKLCFFEYCYVASADSLIESLPVSVVRERLSEQLAMEVKDLGIDLVTYNPRCPKRGARRLAEILGVPFERAFYKLNGVRSFQGPTASERKSSISENLFPLPDLASIVAGKIVGDVDDSVIRGNVARRASELFRGAGAKDVYLLSYTPKIGIIGVDGVKRGCLYGVDMPPEENEEHKFIARGRTDEEIAEEAGVKVRFLSFKGLEDSFRKMGRDPNTLCTFCIGGPNPFKDFDKCKQCTKKCADCNT
jgi:amidophosphoribosyltransferase